MRVNTERFGWQPLLERRTWLITKYKPCLQVTFLARYCLA